ncbi:cobalamin (5'-phosphate) synthase [Acetobacter senegalensis]|uniref:Adenosylcobinamide-GDP ribazoletransferase n=1 Tax=Acetobacter senegalensis TaxID=446692 RepID=A0A0U5ERQ3_9PROT|nr:adenosylcobinamide-GDP ribazoletransferase [Acetobacter senegalensis]CEF40281.1 cobalamin (5'-phosphate) synthase [Acetobacter senegalensis]
MTRTSPFAESLFSRIRLDLACGIGLLTRLPINGLLSARQRAQSGPWPLARSLWCWPLVGGAVGAFTGSMAWGLEAMHVAALPAAGLALAAQSALTGAFHEDGLADMADSYGTHARERKLEIMRDSRIGSYGVLALCLSLLVRAGAIAALPAPALVGGLALAGLLSRATLLWLPRLLPPARPDGLARSLSPLPRGAFAVAQSFAFLLAALLMTVLINGTSQQPVPPENQPLFWRLAPALGLVISAAGLSGWLVARSARKHLAGYTGDVLGAAATVADCLVLAALTILFHN